MSQSDRCARPARRGGRFRIIDELVMYSCRTDQRTGEIPPLLRAARTK